MRGESRVSECGVSLLEVIAASCISLVLFVAIYSFIDASKRQYLAESNLTTAQAAGRACIDILTDDLRLAGYSPLGLRFDAIADGNADRVQRQADLDGDAVLGSDTDGTEIVSYQFVDADGDGLFNLDRGVDRDGDWDFTDTGDSVETLDSHIVRIDSDGDGVDEPFLTYDEAPPDTTWLSIAYGVRTARQSLVSGQFTTVHFQTVVVLRNHQRIR